MKSGFYDYGLNDLMGGSAREKMFFPPEQYLTPPYFPKSNFMPFLIKHTILRG